MNDNDIKRLYSDCRLCPRGCGVNRYLSEGFCGCAASPRIARAALHMWEEPVLSGCGGSGAVFFSGCTLKCIYCQNHDISADSFGRDISVQSLSDTFLRLQDEGAQNIDLITASHFLPQVIAALDIARHRLKIPVVYNCGGYESIEALKLLDGYVDIYLPDIKYYSNELAIRLSAAPHYFEAAAAAVKEMIRQTGKPVLDASGAMKSGVIIRHLVLPSHRSDSINLLKRLADEIDVNSFLISILSQYTPSYKALTDNSYRELSRKLTSFEYDSVVNTALKLNMHGFMQEKGSAKGEYTPSFDLTGVPLS